ncbi:ispA [Wigglesworthia glossinidia endosymbiont of Glossina brevipalpis]|uniref:IspA protein n=1 Tax=Wigglesworthia glossinidia brevipalpis TaxID=36870 RepID=Q8D356_WIGBR|nr:ispA [Wigglesworthia glossinidia endosymbiont of Glossina brevipalpis]
MNNFLLSLTKIQNHINLILKKYLNIFSKKNMNLTLAMKYALLNGGKRLRAFLVYCIGKMLNVSSNNLDCIAASIECIHAYSLIHDDLPSMDNDRFRRGRESCHVKFNEYIAILAGDSLQSLAFNILSTVNMPDVSVNNRMKMISILSYASGAKGMCLGQSLDLENQGSLISIKQLEEIYKYKTSFLIYAATRMTILSSNIKNKKILINLIKYSKSIGLAFQIQDDILNVIGSKKITGKCQGSDKKLNKNTYSSLIGIKLSKEKAFNLYKKSLSYLEYINELGYNTESLIKLAHYIIIRNK